jgi:hypothetical protein
LKKEQKRFLNLTRSHQRKILADAVKNAGAHATEFFD